MGATIGGHVQRVKWTREGCRRWLPALCAIALCEHVVKVREHIAARGFAPHPGMGNKECNSVPSVAASIVWPFRIRRGPAC